ncbi:hypothetical protein JOF53_000425 [Crossiella equi]|uniref:Uncharacterized protein n=1 Tax=Crossiella equi TaxID=130796 RepID=A0ABS5A4S0_9PSEU|nr:DUF5994 family protein [Crossiella equi]MBP2471553.1 hypothetical protein [Crossiella equi]
MSPTSAGTAAARLRLKPEIAASGHVDGAWWPRTTEPASEFPDLVRAASARLGVISRISYNPDVWEAAADRMTVHGQNVAVTGFRSLQPNTVRLNGPDRWLVSLLVIPPGTPDRQAEAVLAAAADPWTLLAVPDLLNAHGIPSDLVRDTIPRQR